MSTKRGKPRAIILITLDALRADHVGCYGYPLDTTPAIDSLASESAMFQYAFSPIGLTAPSHGSILTGKYPRFHSIGFHNGDRPLNKEQDVTLPLILKNLGYETAAFVSILPLQQKLCGLDLGMNYYDDAFTQGELNRPHELRRTAEQTTAAAIRWMSDHKRELFFLWIHFVEPHGPYTPPPPYNTEFVGNVYYGGPPLLEVVDDYKVGGIPAYQVLRPMRTTDGELLNYEKDYRYYVSQYDGNIRFLDDHLRILIQKLRDWQLYDDALFIVTADHGEALGENNIYFQHSLTVSLDQIRVPLFIKAPSWMGMKPGTIAVPVTTVDIIPTVLASCGIEAQYLGLQGLDLSPLLKDVSSPSWPERYILSEIPAQLSVVSGHFQLLYGKGREASQRDPYPPYMSVTEGTKLFHYIADPTGQKDVSASHPDVVERLSTIAKQYLRMPSTVYDELGSNELSEEKKANIKERLKQLGYLVEPESEHVIQKETIEAELQQQRVEREKIEAELQQERAEREKIEVELQQQRAEREKIESELQQQRAETETIEAQLKQAYSCYSWRLTAPLRWTAKIVRKAAGCGTQAKASRS